MPTAVGTIDIIHRYPVKSMQGETPSEVWVDAKGMAGDRQLALLDLESGKVASAKKPKLFRALLDCAAGLEADQVWIQLPSGERLPAAQAVAQLAQLTGRSLQLHQAAAGHLGSYASTWPEIDGVTYQGDQDIPMAIATKVPSFVDMAGLHLLTTGTLASLQRLAPNSQLAPQRFRPSFVIASNSDAEFPEDEWLGKRLRIGEELEIRVSMRTPRCVMTTVQQPGLAEDIAVLRTAATANLHELPGAGKFACVGVYAEVVHAGVLRVGAPVCLLD